MASVEMNSEVSHKAHDIKKKRTQDVRIEESVDFQGLCLSQNVLSGLKAAGFVRPSPIQLKAIPLGRFGLDLIVQAKSGTGKTCVFSVIALENLIAHSRGLQVLVLAPTREIAMQISEVIKSIGSHLQGLSCHVFIGGLPLSEDKHNLQKCQIAVGTPGRIKQLIEENILSVESIRLFVLDEADKLLEDNFQDQINWIFSALPDNKQILALSATYPEYLAQHLQAYMRNPTFVRLNVSDPALFGIRQYYEEVKFHPLPQVQFDEKVKRLIKLLSSVTFQQCLVFSNYQMRAQSLADVLMSQGWPAAYISGSQDQQDRISAMEKLKKMQCRILISTDLTSRGIDVEHVNLVVNLDLPWDHETYLHRIGRAGRFGSYGAAISYTAAGKEWNNLMAIADKCNTTIKQLPDPAPEDLARSSGYTDLDSLVTVEKVINQAGGDATSLVSNLCKISLEKQLNGERSLDKATLDLPLQTGTEITVDSPNSTPTAFMKDLESYSIRQEIGPEDNEEPDWSGALRDVYSLVREIKDMYVSEKSVVTGLKDKESHDRQEAIYYPDVVNDYERYVSDHEDQNFEKWLEDFVPISKDGNGVCSLYESEVKDLVIEINEQNKRLLMDDEEFDFETEDLDDIIDVSASVRVPSCDGNISASDSEASEGVKPDNIVDALKLQKEKTDRQHSHRGRVRMGVGNMLKHLQDGDINEDKGHSGNSNNVEHEYDEQNGVPTAYDDLQLPEVVDFSEYDQSYLYFQQADEQQGYANDYEAHVAQEYESHSQYYDYQDYREEMVGEEMCHDRNYCQDSSAFKWVQDDQNEAQKNDAEQRKSQGKKKKRRDSRSSQQRSRKESDCEETFSESSAATASSKSCCKGHHNMDPYAYHAYPGSQFYLGNGSNGHANHAMFHPWYPYSAFSQFPFAPGVYNPAHYYAAAANMHAQWSEYYQKMCKATKNSNSLSRHYNIQKSYIKSMSHRT